MSTYATELYLEADQDQEQDVHVAADAYGRDVRLTIGGPMMPEAYLTAANARRVAAALETAAARCDHCDHDPAVQGGNHDHEGANRRKWLKTQGVACERYKYFI